MTIDPLVLLALALLLAGCIAFACWELARRPRREARIYWTGYVRGAGWRPEILEERRTGAGR